LVSIIFESIACVHQHQRKRFCPDIKDKDKKKDCYYGFKALFHRSLLYYGKARKT